MCAESLCVTCCTLQCGSNGTYVHDLLVCLISLAYQKICYSVEQAEPCHFQLGSIGRVDVAESLVYAVGKGSLEGRRSTMVQPLPWFEERVSGRSTAGYAGDSVSDAFLHCRGGF